MNHIMVNQVIYIEDMYAGALISASFIQVLVSSCQFDFIKHLRHYSVEDLCMNKLCPAVAGLNNKLQMVSSYSVTDTDTVHLDQSYRLENF